MTNNESNKRSATMAAAAVIEADCECCDVLPERKRRKLQEAYESSQRRDSRSLLKLLPEIARAMEVVSDDDTSSDSEHDDEECGHEHKPLAVKKILEATPQIKPLAAPARLVCLKDNGLFKSVKYPSLPAGKPLTRPPRLFLKKYDKSAVALKEINYTLL